MGSERHFGGQHACPSPHPPPAHLGYGRVHKGGGPKDCAWTGSSSRVFAIPGVCPAQLQQQTDHIKAKPLLWRGSHSRQMGFNGQDEEMPTLSARQAELLCAQRRHLLVLVLLLLL